jgi:hypothetical protein
MFIIPMFALIVIKHKKQFQYTIQLWYTLNVVQGGTNYLWHIKVTFASLFSFYVAPLY